MKYALIQIKKPFDAMTGGIVTTKCFVLWGLYLDINQAYEAARKTEHPEYFIVVQSWLIP